MSEFRLTAKQVEAQQYCAGPATHVMLRGGSRSAKTFLHVRNIIFRALKAPGSRHLMARFRFNHIKASIIMETFPKVMQLAFPGVEYRLPKTDWVAYLGDGSEIWFCGLDDKDRTEKVLGKEFVSILLNECSQIPWSSREMVITRLAQRVVQKIQGKPDVFMKPRVYYDMNPGNMAHWTYRLFHQKINPETKEPLHNPQDYAEFEMNPVDNMENLSPEYIATLKGLSARMQRRFLYGQYSEANPHALFDEAIIDRSRVLDGDIPQMLRIVVAVDPSGSEDEDNLDNNEIGIVVVGLGSNGKAYVLEDCSLKAGPATWGGVGVGAYVRHKADVLVGEKNFGGAMVGQTIKVASQAQGVRCNFKLVTASRGKIARAEPFSALYEQDKICHVGMFPRLEDELTAMSTIGYTGQGSPNRADALIWALAELFPAVVAQPREPKTQQQTRIIRATPGAGGWMG